MKKVNTNGKIPIKLWLDDVEDSALAQAMGLAKLPFAFKHVALMPDCHAGKGMPIGGVLATKGVVIPNAVGVDIGCGMCAIETSLTTRDITPEKIKQIFGGSKEYQGGIRAAVPVGFNSHSKKQDESLMPVDKDNLLIAPKEMCVVATQYQKALKSLGTLGGGNHFIEIQKSRKGKIWIMIHSGSRNLGLTVANHYNKIAASENKRWHSSVPEKDRLAFLPLDSEPAKWYLKEMDYCVRYAFANRKLMMTNIMKCFTDVFPDVKFDEMINIAHNYARMENHFGENVMIHRKGATSAQHGEVGIIPGSQGTKSYITMGLGNPDSFKSCSHGAGRLMSRTKAQENLNLAEEQKVLDDKGIIHAIRGTKDLDEAPSAYKDIDVVMANQEDLTEVAVELTPLAVIKG